MAAGGRASSSLRLCNLAGWHHIWHRQALFQAELGLVGLLSAAVLLIICSVICGATIVEVDWLQNLCVM